MVGGGSVMLWYVFKMACLGNPSSICTPLWQIRHCRSIPVDHLHSSWPASLRQVWHLSAWQMFMTIFQKVHDHLSAWQCAWAHVHSHQILAGAAVLKVWHHDLASSFAGFKCHQTQLECSSMYSLHQGYNTVEWSSGGMVYTVPTVLPRNCGVHVLSCSSSYLILPGVRQISVFFSWHLGVVGHRKLLLFFHACYIQISYMMYSFCLKKQYGYRGDDKCEQWLKWYKPDNFNFTNSYYRERQRSQQGHL